MISRIEEILVKMPLYKLHEIVSKALAKGTITEKDALFLIERINTRKPPVGRDD